jgi:hypothetical protein
MGHASVNFVRFFLFGELGELCGAERTVFHGPPEKQPALSQRSP